MSKELSKYNYENTEEFSLNNLIIEARVVDIYDGDTCTCIIPFNNSYSKFHIRLEGIDTCEIKSKDEIQKNLALEAKKKLCCLISSDFDNIDLNITRKELRKLLNEKCYIIKLKCGEFDKYGRLLGYLFNDNCDCQNNEESYNYCLIREKLAYAYDGGTKQK